MVDYAHCSNVKSSVQMMEVYSRPTTGGPLHGFITINSKMDKLLSQVCRRGGNTYVQANNQGPSAQPIVANLVPTSAANVALAFPPTLTNQYQLYGRTGPRQYTSARSDFPPQLVPPILCPPYQVKYFVNAELILRTMSKTMTVSALCL